ncbi:MAG: 30S ribosomal protein S6 [Deltaproteobacteria bacterium]|nr:30S ribosomal protein S6 [Deltaproteobacteria bacterium]
MGRVATAPGHAREYETIYILRPNTDREKADDVAGKLNDAIKTTGATLTGVELWGQRRLAYPIAKHHRGIYIYVKYLGKGATVAEIERQLRLSDSVIRFQTVNTRDNVPVEGTEAADFASVTFEVPFEPDEPEQTVERELGLDAASLERRRREEREEMEGFDDDEGMDGIPGAGNGDGEEV